MPAFTFEKISPAPREATPTAQPVTTKQAAVVRSRGLIFDLLDRLAVSRLERETAKISTAIPYQRPPPD